MKEHLETLVNQAKKNDRRSQKSIYELLVGKMMAISLSYVKEKSDAEDIVMNAFYKAFTKINQCEKSASFPSWLRRIVVNDSISFIRKNKSVLYMESELMEEIPDTDEGNEAEEYHTIDIKKILANMPTGYQLVFNLYVFEEMKHKEIANILNISEGTSKSQLSKAKKWVKEYLKERKNEQRN